MQHSGGRSAGQFGLTAKAALPVQQIATSLVATVQEVDLDFYAICFGLHQFAANTVHSAAASDLAPASVWLTKKSRIDGRLQLLGLFSLGTRRRTSAE